MAKTNFVNQGSGGGGGVLQERLGVVSPDTAGVVWLRLLDTAGMVCQGLPDTGGTVWLGRPDTVGHVFRSP
jgi:hypothetical protein